MDTRPNIVLVHGAWAETCAATRHDQRRPPQPLTLTTTVPGLPTEHRHSCDR
jgi:hypothetical protein